MTMHHALMRPLRRTVFGVTLALIATAPVTAQDLTARPDAGARLVALFSGLSPERPVQIVTPLLFLQEAHFERLGADFVEVTQEGSTIPVDLSQIRAVSLKNGHPLQGTLWGVGVGALVGSMTGLMLTSFHCSPIEPCDEKERAGFFRWGMVGGLGGGLAGFVIGRYTLTWSPVFP